MSHKLFCLKTPALPDPAEARPAPLLDGCFFCVAGLLPFAFFRAVFFLAIGLSELAFFCADFRADLAAVLPFFAADFFLSGLFAAALRRAGAFFRFDWLLLTTRMLTCDPFGLRKT
ncbi:MAG: hypothetical protein R3208_08655 [Ketobacteraceae bacterium]|nr:hypothetical protein [Ketobacteraceae bacterium]